jgi:hypothetical protein
LSLRLLFELVKFALTSQIERRTSDNTALFFDDGGRQTFDLVFRPLLFRIGPEGRDKELAEAFQGSRGGRKNWPHHFNQKNCLPGAKNKLEISFSICETQLRQQQLSVGGRASCQEFRFAVNKRSI